MARILRGEIRWADLGPGQGHEQIGRRPVLVISHNVFNDRSGTAIVLAVTSRPQNAGFPLSLEIAAKSLPKRSWIKISQVRTLSVERIGDLAARLSPEELARTVEGLNEIIGD
jgi:mRNA interferase MazF